LLVVVSGDGGSAADRRRQFRYADFVSSKFIDCRAVLSLVSDQLSREDELGLLLEIAETNFGLSEPADTSGKRRGFGRTQVSPR
jgi:hypothetical protein